MLIDVKREVSKVLENVTESKQLNKMKVLNWFCTAKSESMPWAVDGTSIKGWISWETFSE